MRILALDLGERRIGLAVSDELGLTAQGLPTLEHTSLSADLQRIMKLAEEYYVERIVVGLPLNMNGTLGPQGQKALGFIEALKVRMPATAIVPWDERLTTRAAERAMLEADLSRAKRKGKVDRLAAVLILQGYLDRAAFMSADLPSETSG